MVIACVNTKSALTASHKYCELVVEFQVPLLISFSSHAHTTDSQVPFGASSVITQRISSALRAR